MKKSFSLIISLLMILSLFSTTVFANASYYNVTVLDYGDMLSDEEEAYLVRKGKAYVSDMNMDIIFLTTMDAEGKSTMTYSDDVADDLIDGFGYNEDAVMFVIDLDNNVNYVNTMGRAIREINDYEVEMILDAAALADLDDYVGCMENMLDKASYVYLNDVSSSYEQSFSFFSPFSIPAGILFAIFTCAGLTAKHKEANKQTNAVNYLDNRSIAVNSRNTRFVRTYEKVHKDYYKPKESSSGGGSSHRSSSGRSHGGGGRGR